MPNRKYNANCKGGWEFPGHLYFKCVTYYFASSRYSVCALFTHIPIQEGRDLSAGAGVCRTKAYGGNTLRNAVFYCP